MVQRRKRTQFTGKFKEHLEKVQTIIQEAIENLPDTDTDSKYLFITKTIWTILIRTVRLSRLNIIFRGYKDI